MPHLDRFVVMRDNAATRRQGAPWRDARPGTRIAEAPEPRIECLDMSEREARGLERDPEVVEMARAIPIRLIQPLEGRETEPGPRTSWGVEAVGADSSPYDGAGVKVAVLDTGIDAGHPAFAGVTLTQRDFSGDGDGDANGHGTHCAGTVFGRDVDGARIGVAPGVTEAAIGKVLSDDGAGSSEMLFEALRWAAEEGARVVSMSLGFDFPGLSARLVEENDLPVALATSIALEAYRKNLRMFDRIMDVMRAQTAFDGGRVILAASGNESQRQIDPDYEVSASVPAAAEGVISVGAVARGPEGLTVAPFSNTNPVLSAPGVDITSARAGGGLATLSGTSMACPHAAGVAALWWQALEGARVPLSGEAIEARMLASARRDGFADGADPADRGQGLVQAPSDAIS